MLYSIAIPIFYLPLITVSFRANLSDRVLLGVFTLEPGCTFDAHLIRIHCVHTKCAFNESESECGKVNPLQEIDCNAHYNSERIENVTHLIKDGRHVQLTIVRVLDEVTSASFVLLFGVCTTTHTRRP